MRVQIEDMVIEVRGSLLAMSEDGGETFSSTHVTFEELAAVVVLFCGVGEDGLENVDELYKLADPVMAKVGVRIIP